MCFYSNKRYIDLSEEVFNYFFQWVVIIIFISSNYLFISGEHWVHYNTNVCSRFCCTTHPFQAFGIHRCCSTWGFGFHPSHSRKCVPMQRCILRLSVLWCNPIGSLFLSTYTTLHTLFGFLPVPCVHCYGFRDCGTPQRSTLCLYLISSGVFYIC